MADTVGLLWAAGTMTLSQIREDSRSITSPRRLLKMRKVSSNYVGLMWMPAGSVWLGGSHIPEDRHYVAVYLNVETILAAQEYDEVVDARAGERAGHHAVEIVADREVNLLDLSHRAEQLAEAHAPDRDVHRLRILRAFVNKVIHLVAYGFQTFGRRLAESSGRVGEEQGERYQQVSHRHDQ